MQYYQYDGRGSVSSLLDGQGRPSVSYRYGAYGETTATAISPNPYTYNGEAYDAVTGFQYLRARYYDPVQGVFLSRDRLEGELMTPLSQNHYIYAGNDPINRIDPSGDAWVLNPRTSMYESNALGYMKILEERNPPGFVVKWNSKQIQKTGPYSNDYARKNLFTYGNQNSSGSSSGSSYGRNTYYWNKMQEANQKSVRLYCGMLPFAMIGSVGAYISPEVVEIIKEILIALGIIILAGSTYVVDNNAKAWEWVADNAVQGWKVTAAAITRGINKVGKKLSDSSKDKGASGAKDASKATEGMTDDKKQHILQDKHNWNKLVPNPKDPNNWGKIAGIIAKVMQDGKEEPHKSVLKKVLKVGGKVVEVTYKIVKGKVRISDAWVK